MTKDKRPKKQPALGAAIVDISDPDERLKHAALIRRRAAHVGGSFLFYHDPVHIIRGEGVWLYDTDGKKYLDCYNNVASVGHCHPQVIRALTQQASILNTHTRYLHEEVVDFAETLSSTLPAPLEVCYFVNSGTEANELAARMARAATGHQGFIVLENSYHGNSTLVGELSTITYSKKKRPEHVQTVPAPDLYLGAYRDDQYPDSIERYVEHVDHAIQALKKSGINTAAFICDTIFDSQGSLDVQRDYFKSVYDLVRRAGGICIADEVQAGLCRTGKWWGFEHYDVIPDIVTMGKPLGAGHPVAAVVTTREIADAFSQESVYFNTFGGNPVSMAVAKTVVDICTATNMPQHVADTGRYLRDELTELSEEIPVLGNLRGLGLFLGIEIIKDHNNRTPAPEIARLIPDAIKQRGVLLGLSGVRGSTLKIRPPLVFNHSHVDIFIGLLRETLHEIT